MIIQLESVSTEYTQVARRSLEIIGQNWGTEITETPAAAAHQQGARQFVQRLSGPCE